MARPNVTPVPAFLVLGSFPLANTAMGHWLECPYECESQFAPLAGDEFDGRKWFPVESDEKGFVDLLHPALPLAERRKCYAYCFTYIKSDSAKNARLLLGSDDGVAVWLNGEEVHRIDMQRGVNIDQDDVAVRLKKGWNALLIKVAQDEGGWALMARMAAKSGPLKGVTFSLKAPRKEFMGIKGRLEPIKTGNVPPSINVVNRDGQLQIALALSLFNDSSKATGQVQLSLADAEGNNIASAKVKGLGAFGSGQRILELDVVTLANAIERGETTLVAASRNGEVTQPLPSDVLPQIFVRLASGIPMSVDSKASMTLPESWQGKPGLVEFYASNPAALPREAAWPKMPSRVVKAAESRGGAVSLGLTTPKGIPGLAARYVFGDGPTQELVNKVRFMVTEMGAGLGNLTESGADGLHAMVRGNTSGVRKALEQIFAAIEAQMEDRSNEKVTLVGHAHIDMNWLWVMWESFLCCHDSFRQALSFMKEFPDFHFSQSQTSCYRMIQKHDPEMFEEIRKRVKEGRWELLGGAVDEGDTNLSSGEAICRTMLLGQSYFKREFGKTARIGWLPDNFGHVAQLPQILKLSGVDYFYAHRCQPKKGAYNWEAPDGSRVLAFVTTTYNGEIEPALKDWPSIYDPKHRDVMWVYGVGDHGGGPSRRDITRAKAYNELPGFPTVEFGTAEGFFNRLEKRSKDYPVTKGELQYTFEGCYTSISSIKEANRRGENTLYAAELFSALGLLDGDPYPQEEFNEAWEVQCFNQFHDILCGSAVHESNQESAATYYGVISKADYILHEAMRRLAARVDTTGGRDGAQPVVVFNPLAQKVSDIVEAEIFCYQPPTTARLRGWGEFPVRPVEPIDVGQGPYASICLEDGKGRSIPAQIIEGKLFPNGYRAKAIFHAKDIPAGGWSTFYAYPNEPGEGEDPALKVDGTTIETRYLKVSVDAKTGAVTRIYDKDRKREVLQKNAAANLLRVYMEEPHGMTAWDIGPISEIHDLNKAEYVKVSQLGPVRAVIESRHKWNRSEFVQRVIVYRDEKRVDFELDATWFELGNNSDGMPMLRVSFPLNVQKGRFLCDTPFAVCERTTDGQEVPAQKWVDLSDAKGGAAILSDSKYGFRCDKNVTEMTVLRASYDPDPYPDQGPHSFRYSLLPHSGNWSRGKVDVAGQLFNTRLQAMETPPSKGRRESSGSSVEVAPANLHLSTVKKAEDSKAWVIRIHESRGKATDATIRLPKPAKRVARVNVLEENLAKAAKPVLKGDTIRLKVSAHEIVSLKVTF